MAGSVVGDLYVGLNLEGADFSAGLNAAKRQLDGLKVPADEAGKAVGKAGEGLGALQRNAGPLIEKNTLQNLGWQFRQIGEQAQASGGGIDAWVRAVGTQLPDIIGAVSGALGPMGVALGVAGGLLAPFVLKLFTGADGAKRLSDAVKELSGAFDIYKSKVQDAVSPMGDLEKRFGSMADRMGPILRSAAANARIGMVDEIRAGLTEATALLDENADVMAGLQPRMFASEFGLVSPLRATTDEAAKLGAALRSAMMELRQAPDLSAQIDAAIRLREAYAQIADASGGRSEEERAYLDNLDAIITKLAEMKAQDEFLAAATGQAAAVAEQTATSYEEAAAASQALADAATIDPEAIERANSAIADLKTNWEDLKLIIGTDMSGVAGPFIAAIDEMIAKAGEGRTVIPEQLRAMIDEMGAIAETARAHGTAIGAAIVEGAVAGMDAKRGALAERARALASQVSVPFREALEIHSPSRVFEGYGQNIGEGLVRGIDAASPQVQASASGMAAAVDGAWRMPSWIDEMTGGVQGFGSEFTAAVKSVAKGAETMKSAIAGLVDSLADKATNSLFDGIWGALFGNGADPLSAAMAGIPGFANGVRSFSGGLAFVGERGRELVSMPGGSRVYNSTETSRLLRQDRGPAAMNMTIDLRGTTGDDGLDAKMRAAGERILAQAKSQAPGWVADHDKRNG